MLFRLIIMIGCTGSLIAKDWSKVCQEVLSLGIKPTAIKETKTIKGCKVDYSCGEFDPLTSQSHAVLNNELAKKDEVLIFVSFSMPEASLKALSEAAPHHKAVLVMRGLYEDSFVKTSAKLQQMGVMVDIHPDLFEQYHIERVPVFVKLKQGREVARLSGNVSLAFAVSKLDETS